MHPRAHAPEQEKPPPREVQAPQPEQPPLNAARESPCAARKTQHNQINKEKNLKKRRGWQAEPWGYLEGFCEEGENWKRVGSWKPRGWGERPSQNVPLGQRGRGQDTNHWAGHSCTGDLTKAMALARWSWVPQECIQEILYLDLQQHRCNLEMIILSEISQRKTNTIWYHLYVKSRIGHKWTYLWNKNRLKDIENRRWLPGERRIRGGTDWEFGGSRCKLLCIEWINSKVLL